MTYRIDADEVLRGLELLAPAVFEVRCLQAKLEGEWRTGTFCGFFDRDHFGHVVDSLRYIERAAGCYFTPNPVNASLLGRAYNQCRMVADKAPATADKDIDGRRWLLIDVDPVRPAGISSTLAEKAASEGVVTAIDNWLWERGFPAGVLADSGNGSHLYIPIRLEADDGSWCKRMLNGLAKMFDTPQAKVDTSCFNASRIFKLPGTLSCKGDHAPEIGREWRMSKILCVCEQERKEHDANTN